MRDAARGDLFRAIMRFYIVLAPNNPRSAVSSHLSSGGEDHEPENSTGRKRLFMLFPTPTFTGMQPGLSVCDRVEKKFGSCTRRILPRDPSVDAKPNKAASAAGSG
jgi:hypothetical protein